MTVDNDCRFWYFMHMRGKTICEFTGAIRAGSEMDTEKVGKLKIGEEIAVTKQKELDDGTMRVKFERGWTSVMAGKSGRPLLELVAAWRGRAARQSIATWAAAVPSPRTRRGAGRLSALHGTSLWAGLQKGPRRSRGGFLCLRRLPTVSPKQQR